MSVLTTPGPATLPVANSRIIRVTLPGRPMTKKNTGIPKTVTRKTNSGKMSTFTFMLPSGPYQDWMDGVLTYTIPIQRALGKAGISLPLANDVSIAALVYKDRDYKSDAAGYYQAIGDCIQAPIIKYKQKPPEKGGGWSLKETRKGLGLIFDDVQILHWDGSRILLDRAKPRVELTITIYGEPRTAPQQPGMFDHQEEDF